MKSAQKPVGKANTQKGNAFPSRCGFDLTERFLLFRTLLCNNTIGGLDRITYFL